MSGFIFAVCLWLLTIVSSLSTNSSLSSNYSSIHHYLSMPLPRKIPLSDEEIVRRYVIESMPYEQIANIYTTTRQTVYNFVNSVLGGKYTNITTEDLIEMIKEQQTEHKQTHGFSMIKSALAQQNIRVPDHFLRECIRQAVPALDNKKP